MADPVTVGAIGIGSSIFGGITGAAGAETQGKAQAAQSMAQARVFNYQAGVAQVNKDIALQNADYTRKVGEVQAQESGMKTRSQVGTARAVQSAGGLDVNTGSNARVRESIQDIGEHEQGVVRADAAKKAYGYEVEATMQEAQKNIYNMSADNARMAAGYARKAGDINAVSSILGAASSVSSKWMIANQKGAFGSGSSGSGGESIDSDGIG